MSIDESLLVHGRAARMDEGAVRTEIARIERGMKCAQSVSATKRYQTRLAIFRERLRHLTAKQIPPPGFFAGNSGDE